MKGCFFVLQSVTLTRLNCAEFLVDDVNHSLDLLRGDGPGKSVRKILIRNGPIKDGKVSFLRFHSERIKVNSSQAALRTLFSLVAILYRTAATTTQVRQGRALIT